MLTAIFWFVVRWRFPITAATIGLTVGILVMRFLAWAEDPAYEAEVDPSVIPTGGTRNLGELVRQCAPGVAPNTMLAIMRTESSFNTLALHVNADVVLRRSPQSAAEAISWSETMIKRGYSVDMGLMQLNSRNLARFKMSVADAFEPCRNIRAAAIILSEQYHLAAQTRANTREAVLAAISAYNTGNFREGFRNGYVAKVLANGKGH